MLTTIEINLELNEIKNENELTKYIYISHIRQQCFEHRILRFIILGTCVVFGNDKDVKRSKKLILIFQLFKLIE